MEDATSLQAVYYPGPVPSGAASLTVMGIIFDRIHFPNVYIPRGGFDETALIEEIKRLESLDQRTPDTVTLISAMKIALHADSLHNICVFTGEEGQIFGGDLAGAEPIVEALYEAIHGPPRENFTPVLDKGSHKSFPSDEQYVDYPGAFHYPANAILYSGKTGIPLVNDNPYIPIPAIPQEAAENNAALLSTILTMECVKLLLPEIRPLQPAELKNLRAELSEDLQGFRVSILKLAKELNSGLKQGAALDEVQDRAQFLVRTDVRPRLVELKDTLEAPARPWAARFCDGAMIIPQLACSLFTMPTHLAIAQALMNVAGILQGEDKAARERNEAARRSGISYLLKLQEKIGR